jgi:hypothetical protein
VDGSTMLFGATPGDGWSCASPCSYTYPDVGSR